MTSLVVVVQHPIKRTHRCHVINPGQDTTHRKSNSTKIWKRERPLYESQLIYRNSEENLSLKYVLRINRNNKNVDRSIINLMNAFAIVLFLNTLRRNGL